MVNWLRSLDLSSRLTTSLLCDLEQVCNLSVLGSVSLLVKWSLDASTRTIGAKHLTQCLCILAFSTYWSCHCHHRHHHHYYPSVLLNYSGHLKRYQTSLTSFPSACFQLLLPPVVTPGTSRFAVNYVERGWAEFGLILLTSSPSLGARWISRVISFTPNQSLVSQLCLLGQVSSLSDQINF